MREAKDGVDYGGMQLPADEMRDGKPKRKPKSAHGEGGLRFDAGRGLWIGRVMVGRRSDGKPDRRYVAAKSQKEARAKLQQLRQDVSTGQLADPHKLTVREFFADWLEKTVKVRREGNTYRQYESLIRVHALPSLGSKPIKQVRRKHIDQLYRSLEVGTAERAYKTKNGKPLSGRPSRRDGLAPKTIRGLHVVLHAGFERARKLNLVTVNPADDVELPTAPRRKKLAIELADVQRLLFHAARAGDRFAPLWVFLANTGLRIGEALALTWDRVDLYDGWFTIDQNRNRDAEGRRKTGAPKTEAGEREIPLTGPALAALRGQQERQAEDRQLLNGEYDPERRGLVFTTRLGTQLDERNVLRFLKRAAHDAGVNEAICLHDLRRMTASLLVASGVDITTAAAIMGHKNASILLDVYAQALRAPKLAAVRKLEGALYGELSTTG